MNSDLLRDKIKRKRLASRPSIKDTISNFDLVINLRSK